MLITIWSAYKPAYVRPLAFIADIQKAVQNTPYVMFGQPMQNDAHEYLAYLMDQFHEELKTDSAIVLQEDTTMQGMANRAWNQFLSKNMSDMVRIFFGMLRKTVQCSNCQNKTYQWEICNMLKIPCEGQTFEEWIQKEVNEVTDIDEYKCDGCNGRHPAKKYSHLWRAPEHLFIVLHRFQGNGMKVMTGCPGTEILSLAPFFAEEVENKAQQYELCGIGDHHGAHIHGGHYTAQSKHPISNEWWFYDDERAGELGSPQFSPANYIFSYRLLQ